MQLLPPCTVRYALQWRKSGRKPKVVRKAALVLFKNHEMKLGPDFIQRGLSRSGVYGIWLYEISKHIQYTRYIIWIYGSPRLGANWWWSTGFCFENHVLGPICFLGEIIDTSTWWFGDGSIFPWHPWIPHTKNNTRFPHEQQQEYIDSDWLASLSI